MNAVPCHTSGRRALVLRLALWAAMSVTACQEARAQPVLDAPSGDDLAIVAYDLAGTDPPFAIWAKGLRDVATLDEFKRPPAAAAAEKRLRSRAEAIHAARLIKVTFLSRFGEYNDMYHEFDLDIDDGTIVTFHPAVHPGGVILHFANGGLAQAWPLPAEEAAKVVALAGGDRSVSVTAKVELQSAMIPGGESAPIEIIGKVLEYDLVSAAKHVRLGHVVVH